MKARGENMPRQNPVERRIHPRRRSSIGTRVKKMNQSYFSHLRNISQSGAFIHSFSATNHRIGENVIVSLPSKNKEQIRLVSKIVRMDANGIGVKFLRHHSAA
jgi:hypothetical protein